MVHGRVQSEEAGINPIPDDVMRGYHEYVAEIIKTRKPKQ